MFAIASLAWSASANATVTCETDDFGRPGVSITGRDAVALKVGAGGAITYDPGANGDAFLPCGNATVTSTDTIFVGGQAGTPQGLIIDLSGGQFAPGFSTVGDATGIAEIEWSVNLQGSTLYTPDQVWVKGSEGHDGLRAAGTGAGGLDGVSRGLELNWTGSSAVDGDLDVVFPGETPGVIKLRGEGGPDSLLGRTIGYLGADPSHLLEFFGGPGDDFLDGTGRTSTRAACAWQANFSLINFRTRDLAKRWECLIGGRDEDRLFGERGNDMLRGSSGRDLLRGHEGNDRLNGGDGEDRCDGGPGRDSERNCEP